MQAIEDVELPCKFADEGCKHVGTRAVLKQHLPICSFRPIPPKIECQMGFCKELVTKGEVVDHLIDKHNSRQWVGNFGTERSSTPRLPREMSGSGEIAYFPPHILSITGSDEDHTFFLNTMIRDQNWKFWATYLGSKDDARKFEVHFSLQGVSFIRRVFSTDEKKKDILADREEDGVLRLHGLLGSFNDGKFTIKLDSEIYRL